MSNVYVGYKNILDDKAELKEIEANSLITAAYRFAKSESDEIYKAVIDEKVALTLNGELVEVDEWKYTTVEDGDKIEIISKLSGGKGKFLGFLMIALGVAAIIFSAGMTAPIALTASISLSPANVLMMGISWVLSGMARLLFSPDLPNSTAGNTRETQTYSWSGIKTTARSDTPIPIIYGTCMTGGNVISAFTDIQDNDNYLNMLIALGEGEIEGICKEDDHSSVCTTSDPSDASYVNPAIYVNDQPLRNYNNVQWWYRTGTNTQTKIPGFDGSKEQFPDGRELTTDWTEYTTTKKVDSVDIHLNIPALYDSSGKTKVEATSVSINVDFKEESEGSYHSHQFVRWQPHYQNSGNGWMVAEQYKDTPYIYDEKPKSYYIKCVSYHTTTQTSPEPEVPDITWIDSATLEIKDGSGNIEYEEVHFGYRGADAALTKVYPYVVHLSSSFSTWVTLHVYSTSTNTYNYEIRGLTKSGIIKTLKLDFNSITGGSGYGKYTIRLRRTSNASTSMEINNNIYLKNVIEVINGDLTYPNTALLGLRMKATDQLSGGIPNTRTLIKGLKIDVPNHSGTEPFYDLFYNETLDRFEYGGAERTWDGVSYTSDMPSTINLVGYWSLDDGTGTIAVDNSGNGNDGTLYGSPTWTTGISGTCLDFDGIDDYVVCGNDSSLDPGANNFSLSIWIKAVNNADPGRTLFLKNSAGINLTGPSDGIGYSLYLTSGGLVRFVLSDGTNEIDINTSTAYDDDTWYHIVAVRDGASAEIFIDSVSQTSGNNASLGDLSNTGDLKIGGTGGQYFTGSIDEARIYNRALTESEIKALYLKPNGKPSEYSENSMLCVRDLVVNDRYGIGKYLSTSDLYNTGIINAIKSCHKKWYPTVLNYLSWYTSESSWNNNWNFIAGSGTNDASAQTISPSGNPSYSIQFKLKSFISPSVEHDFKITLSSVTGNNLNINLYGVRGSDFTKNVSLGSLSNKGDGQHTITFTPTVNGINSILVVLENKDLASGNSADVSFTITAIELKNSSTSAEHYHTMNGAIDSKQSATTALFEACDSFRCWPVWFKGTYNFVLNEDVTPTHNITAGNIKDFKESFTPLSEVPYKIYGEYLDKDLDYEMKSIVAKTTDSTIPTAREKTLGMKWLNDRKRVERELKFKLNAVINTKLSINFKCGLDSIHATAGDVVNIQHPLPQWGSGGRLLSYNQASAFAVLDEPFTFDDVTATYLLKYQTSENSYVTATVDTSGFADGDSSDKIPTISWPASNPVEDSVYLIGSTSNIKPFRLIKVSRNTENEVEVDAVEHLPSIYSEQDIVTIRDNYSQLAVSMPAKPNPLSALYIKPTDLDVGIGFEFTVDIGQQNVQDVIIQMSTDQIFGYKTLLVLDSNQKTARYIDGNLALNQTYYFKAFCRNGSMLSDPLYVSFELKALDYIPSAPTGIHLKGNNPNTVTFDDKDIVLQWNPVGAIYSTPGPLSGYVVEVYHTSVTSSNLLRTAFVKSEEYTYTLGNNISDSSDGNPYNTLIFVLYTQTNNNILSEGSIPFKIINPVPATVSGLTANPFMGGVTFSWNKSTEQDHKNYKTSVKVESEAYRDWNTVINNSYTYSVNATDKNNYSGIISVKLRVKDVDSFDQESAVAASLQSGTLSVIADNTASVGDVDASNVAGWAYSGDTTQINGESIAVNTLDANKLNVVQLSAITANMGELTSGVITGAEIRTASSGQRAVMNSYGIRLETGATAFTWGDSSYLYGDSTRKYGTGVLAYILHSSKKIPFYIQEEQDVADFHFFSRSSDPIATAEVGDICFVNGDLRKCITAGNPGVWATV